MNKNLLILGAGVYGTVIKEIAEDMGCFEKIAFLDDTFGQKEGEGSYHKQSIGKLEDYENFVIDYTYAIVAIGDGELRANWMEKLEEVGYRIPVIVSPKAYVSKSAQIQHGSVVEPMAVVHANVAIAGGVFISTGAIVNHNSFISQYSHVDCNAVIMCGAIVLPYEYIEPCRVIRKDPTKFTIEKTIVDGQEKTIIKKKTLPRTPDERFGEYKFEDGF